MPFNSSDPTGSGAGGSSPVSFPSLYPLFWRVGGEQCSIGWTSSAFGGDSGGRGSGVRGANGLRASPSESVLYNRLRRSTLGTLMNGIWPRFARVSSPVHSPIDVINARDGAPEDGFEEHYDGSRPKLAHGSGRGKRWTWRRSDAPLKQQLSSDSSTRLLLTIPPRRYPPRPPPRRPPSPPPAAPGDPEPSSPPTDDDNAWALQGVSCALALQRAEGRVKSAGVKVGATL